MYSERAFHRLCSSTSRQVLVFGCPGASLALVSPLSRSWQAQPSLPFSSTSTSASLLLPTPLFLSTSIVYPGSHSSCDTHIGTGNMQPILRQSFQAHEDGAGLTESSQEPSSAPQRNTADLTDQSECPFVCNICKRSYSRIDHLARHHRSRSCSPSCASCHLDLTCDRYARKTLFLPSVQQGLWESVSTGRLTYDEVSDEVSRDLLKRHLAAHSDGQTPKKRQKTTPSTTKPRVSQACTACAEAKLKCEQKKPCSRCEQKRIVCHYAPTKRNAGPDVQYASDDGECDNRGLELCQK